MMEAVDVIVVIDDRGERHLVPLNGATQRVEGLGVLDTQRLRANLGRRMAVGGRTVLAMPASRRDRMEGLTRGPQTVSPKDAAAILFWADIGPGATVVEAGTGSGLLSVALAVAVGPRGRVLTYERREDIAALARENLRNAGVADRVDVRTGDVREGIPERDIDAVVLDVPDPWAVIRVAWEALKVGGSISTFSPNMEQMKETVAELRRRPFVEIRTIEVIEREMEVRDVGVRPSFAPLGHTGYLTFARKVLDTI